MATKREEEFTADGKTRVFPLKQAFRMVTSVKLDGREQVKNVRTSPANNDPQCEVDFAEHSIVFPANVAEGAEVKVAYLVD